MKEETGTYSLEFYQTLRGYSQVKDFLETFPEKIQKKTGAWLLLLEQTGPNLCRPYADVLAEPIRELRISFGSLAIRLLYFFHGKSIVVTNGFLKKTRKVPAEEIDMARRCRADWLARGGGSGA